MACPLGTILADKTLDDCSKKLLIAHDILDVLHGKWKMEVILALLQYERRRFKQLQKDVNGISSKVLSSVLKDLESNHIVMRKILDAAATTVEYELTDYGKSLRQTLIDFVNLGVEHRKEVIG